MKKGSASAKPGLPTVEVRGSGSVAERKQWPQTSSSVTPAESSNVTDSSDALNYWSGALGG